MSQLFFRERGDTSGIVDTISSVVDNSVTGAMDCVTGGRGEGHTMTSKLDQALVENDRENKP